MPPATLHERALPAENAQFWYMTAIAVLVFSFAIRLAWYPVITTDYTYFVAPWFATLAAHQGLSAFAAPFADYAPLYLYLLKLLTYLPVGSLISAKSLSLLFDIASAYLGYRILRRILPEAPDYLHVLGGVALLALPTVMMNSSLWGQSDALYGAPVLGALLALLADAPLAAMLAFGIALSFKVQAIFFAPVFLGYLARQRRLAYALIPPLVFLVSVLPAALAGGDSGYWLTIYARQAGEYPYLSVSAQSAFAFVQPLTLSPVLTSALFWLGVALALLFSGALIMRIVRAPVLTMELLLLASLAAALLLPYLLPRMHERYFYLADLFSVLYAFVVPRRFFIPILVVTASLLSYMPFLSSQIGVLSGNMVDLRIPAAILLVPIACVLYDLFFASARVDNSVSAILE